MKKFDNFCNALFNLGKINDYSEPYDTVILTGLVGRYEIGEVFLILKGILYCCMAIGMAFYYVQDPDPDMGL